MNPILEVVVNIFGSIFILLTAYGAIKQKRDIFLFGICFFSIVSVISELIAYAQDDNVLHLFIIIIFLGQVIVTLPINTRFDEKNKAATALSNRIGCAILVINLFQGALILNNYIDVPHQFGFMHLVIALIMLYTVLRSGKDEI
jgi:hypothetical protein